MATTRTAGKAGARKTPTKKKRDAGGDGAGFQGFPRGGDAFFRELAAQQDRDWFKANKDRYETCWNQPIHALVDSLAERLEKRFPGASQTKRKVFRIHRDVRFSADKSPYKTHAAAVLPLVPSVGSEMSSLVCYMHFGADERFLGLGYYELPKTALDSYRKAVAAKTGETLARHVGELEERGFEVGSRESLKRVPPGFPQDHPRAELLKRKGLILRFPTPPKALLGKPDLVDWIADRAAETLPVVRWMQKHVAV